LLGAKGLRKNHFTELAPKFRSDLAAPIEQIQRNPDPIGISRILRLRCRQRWAEGGMRKCDVIFAEALRYRKPLTSPFPSRMTSGISSIKETTLEGL
jgi:hypothetical protein